MIFRFISTPVGFRYLFDVGYINQEMDTWFHVGLHWRDCIDLVLTQVAGAQYLLCG